MAYTYCGKPVEVIARYGVEDMNHEPWRTYLKPFLVYLTHVEYAFIMPLSQQTIDEMKAGMRQVAEHAGKDGVDPEYMAALIRTGIRANWLKTLERENKITITRVPRRDTGNKDCGRGEDVYVVHVGDNQFEDINGQMTGQWPSEVLVAQVALALAAGEGDKIGAAAFGDIPR